MTNLRVTKGWHVVLICFAAILALMLLGVVCRLFKINPNDTLLMFGMMAILIMAGKISSLKSEIKAMDRVLDAPEIRDQVHEVYKRFAREDEGKPKPIEYDEE